jgi:tryptophan synthase alpha chain
MNRLEKHFAELQSKNEKALILFITAGDPNLDETLKIMESLAKNGADCIELGIPFSDPIADGPVIQQSTSRALKNNVQLGDILAMISKFRQNHDTPIVCMGYFNPILRYGEDKFIKAFHAAGGDGLIIADLPFEEGEEYEKLCKNNGVNLIYLLAPEIGSERTKRILASSSGFVYCVSHYGTTGEGATINSTLGEITKSLRKQTKLPLAVGFGISSLQSAKKVSKDADGIIIGSWLIKELENAGNKQEKAGEFTKSVKQAITG